MDFLQALKKRKAEGPFPVIPDIKCFSPKEGDLIRGRDPAALAEQLEAAGACVLSVVTEPDDFHGSLQMLREICNTVRIPVLRKDFIGTKEDLILTKEAGASAILLIYSCLGKDRLKELYEQALGIGLVPFVETHTAQELEWAAELGARLIGINNRDILKLERDDGDVSRSEDLMRFRPRQAFLVAESGMMSGEDVRRAARCGADAALVGTAILREKDPGAMYRAMTRPCGLKICGLMDPEGVRLCLEQHVDVLGFVTEYPVPVPWNLRKDEAADLLSSARDLCGRLSSPAGLCVVTGGTPDKVIRLARDLRPDLVQLHYTETAEETVQIAEALHREGIQVIRSIPQDKEQKNRMFGTADPAEIARSFSPARVDALLLDARDAANATDGGGSILEHVDLTAVQQMRSHFAGKIILGGGLTAQNIRRAADLFRPDLTDVMTGVETGPGKKSEALLKELIKGLEQS